MSTPPRRPDASMTLITSMLARPLDPGYAAAARERAAGAQAPRTARGRAAMLLSCVVVGLLLATAAMTLRQNAAQQGQVRADLLSRIDNRRADGDTTAKAIADAEARIAQLEQAALGVAPGTAGDLARLRSAVGAESVTGPGLTVTVDDAPGTDTATGSANGRVLAKDVAFLVNALWAAGAEAIAVNDQRLSGRSAIRFAGDAILVNFRPLARPYRITAIGDPATLPAAFAEGPGGSYLTSLSDNYGVMTEVSTAPKVTLPRTTSLTLTYAHPKKEGS